MTYAVVGFNMMAEYAKANPYNAAVAGTVVVAGTLACALVGKWQRSAAVVQKVAQQTNVSVNGTICTLTNSQKATVAELTQEVAAMTSRENIKKLVLELDHSLQFSSLEAQQLVASFPKLTDVVVARSARQTIWQQVSKLPKFEHITFESSSSSAAGL